MPIYEYKCKNCGEFTKMQKISAQPLAICPTCGGEVERMISKNVGVVFKGSGFYTTDNKQIKDRARSLNKERQKDNQALLDGDVGGYVKQADSTDKKVSGA
jgi:putative FmdB family regulatory protein